MRATLSCALHGTKDARLIEWVKAMNGKGYSNAALLKILLYKAMNEDKDTVVETFTEDNMSAKAVKSTIERVEPKISTNYNELEKDLEADMSKNAEVIEEIVTSFTQASPAFTKEDLGNSLRPKR